MKITPTEDRIVIDPVQLTEEKRGLLFIPSTAQEVPTLGKVRLVGPGRYENGQFVPMRIKVGQHVLFAKFSGTIVNIHGTELKIIHEPDVLAIVDMEGDEARIVDG